MKSNDHFSEQVLEQTLRAVRHGKRRRTQHRAALAVCVIATSLTVFFRQQPDNEVKTLAYAPKPESPEAKNPVVFSTASINVSMTVFSTRDSAVEVTHINTDEMSAILAETPHGFYETTNGQTHLWLPLLAHAD